MEKKFELGFYETWLEEVKWRIKKLQHEIIEMTSPYNREIWEIESKEELYNSDKDLAKFFSEEIIFLNEVKESRQEEKPFKEKELNVYKTLKTKIEKKIEEYK